MQGLIEGRMVHYVHAERKWQAESGKPGAYVEVRDEKCGQHEVGIVAGVLDAEKGLCNLFVIEHSGAPCIRTEVPFSEAGEPNTWHWIERV